MTQATQPSGIHSPSLNYAISTCMHVEYLMHQSEYQRHENQRHSSYLNSHKSARIQNPIGQKNMQQMLLRDNVEK